MEMIRLAMLAIDKDIFLNLIDIGMKACRCEFLTFHPVTYIMKNRYEIPSEIRVRFLEMPIKTINSGFQ